MSAPTLDTKLTVSMPQEMALELRAYVDAGKFSSTSEVVRDAIRVWQRQQLDESERLAVLRARVRSSLDDPDPNFTSAEVRAQLETLFDRAHRTERDAAAKG